MYATTNDTESYLGSLSSNDRSTCTIVKENPRVMLSRQPISDAVEELNLTCILITSHYTDPAMCKMRPLSPSLDIAQQQQILVDCCEE